jgi:threonine dehydratase
MSLDAAAVEEAADRLAAIVARTPVECNERLSARAGGEVWLKREDLQVVRSYKVRGAYNLLAQLDDAARSVGVVAASAGNHAQGVAYACRLLGIDGCVHLPRTTPRQKRDRIAALGGDRIEIVVTGDTYDDAAAAALEYAAATGATVVPAFDDVRTAAGQGTVVLEAFAQLSVVGRRPDLVVLPVGGGGLLAGAASWICGRHPGVRVVGVEPAGAASMAAALAAGEPVNIPVLDAFVDGAAVRRVGAVTYPVVRDSGVEVLSVPEGRVCSEMLSLYQADGIIAEPAGALAPAAVGYDLQPGFGLVTLCVLSGGNNDVSRYAEVVERALVHEGLKHYFLVEFPQEPGALRRFLDEVLGPDDDITLFEYVKRSNRETGPALVGVELGRPEDLEPLLQRMASAPPRIERVPPDSPLFRFVL